MQSLFRHALTLRVEAARSEVLSAILYDLGTLGIEQLTETSSIIELTAYFESSARMAGVATRLPRLWRKASQPRRALRILSRSTVPQHDWVGQWKRDYRPIRVGNFQILPSWLADETSTKSSTTIILDPQNAFGSGTHASTRLCLLGIAEYYIPNTRALDIGTGSGILAIAMALQSRAESPSIHRIITAIDPDPDAIETARENARRNRVKGRIRFQRKALENLRAAPFPFVVANLTALDLAGAAHHLSGLCGRRGVLLLSGLQNCDVPEIRAVYRRLGYRHLKTRTQEDWSLLVFHR